MNRLKPPSYTLAHLSRHLYGQLCQGTAYQEFHSKKTEGDHSPPSEAILDETFKQTAKYVKQEGGFEGVHAWFMPVLAKATEGLFDPKTLRSDNSAAVEVKESQPGSPKL